MRRRWFVAGALVALSAAVMGVMPSASAAPSGRYIVVLKDSVASPLLAARQQAGRYGANVGFVYSHALKGYSAALSSQRVAALRANPNVAAVVDDLPVHAT